MLSSLGRALDIVEMLARAQRPLGLGEIARELGISKSSVHDVLTTLAARGFVERQPGGIYRLGLKAWEVGAAASVTPLVQAAASIMARLAAELQENVDLGVLSGFESVNVHIVDGVQTVRVYAPVGTRFLAHQASTGLVLLAFQAPGYLDKVMPAVLPPATPQTITDHDELRRELQRVRLRGYAINQGGWRLDVAGVAAPVLNTAGIAIAALCVAAPRYRTTRVWMRRVVPAMQSAAAQISDVLNGAARALEGRTAS
ncbi:MAG TPA: IclR family transcriptional regulator [Candidatus Sulfotelmatobacter sp.]|nr:IclR family transcriptional regulator [Candidatus Sulfotelmatobacter sp.]